MSALEDVKKAASYAVPALEALGLVLAITSGGGTAEAIVAGVEAALKTFTDGVSVGATPADISAQLARQVSELAANDAAADASVDAKFPR